MAKAKPKPQSPFEGRWRIVFMTEWNENYLDAEGQAFIDFDAKGGGEFQFGYVGGSLDYQVTTRDGEPAVEWTWEGSDEMDLALGRGWAVLEGDKLHGLILFHDDSGFVAKRVDGQKPAKTRRAKG
jgi:hypothetical protein